MIIAEKLEKPYDEIKVRAKIWLRCDYCGKEFERVKKSILRVNSIVAKDSCGSKDCSNAKREEICLIKYGVKNFFETEHWKKKNSETNLRKYGTEEYFYSEDFKEKRKDTLLQKYGIENPLQSPEIRQKQEDTMEKLYGVRNASQAPDFLDKIESTNMEKYGEKYYNQTDECKERIKKTQEEKYGKMYTQTEEYWERRKKTCLEKYGVEHPHQNPDIKEKAKKTCRKRYGKDYYVQTDKCKEDYKEICTKRYGVPNPLCLHQNQRYGKTQSAIREWLNSFGFNFQSTYKVLGNREIDLYDQQINLAIEFCGTFWHCEACPNPKDRLYHHDKYKRCLDQGIRLITIFEDEWKHKEIICKSILKYILGKTERRVFARACSVEQCGQQEFNDFCHANHLQGSNRLSIVRYVLKLDNDIVAAMSFGRHPRNMSSITLDRLISKVDHSIVGAASRLFHHCLAWAKENKYDKVITWSDNRWSQGSVYKNLGFVLDAELRPDYSYVYLSGVPKRTSKQSQKKSSTGCPPEITEREWALKHGLARIWDCGKRRWLFSI